MKFVYKLVVVCDARWTNYYNQGVSSKSEDPDEFADILWKTEQMIKYTLDRKASRSVKFISMDKCPKEKVDARHVKPSAIKCQAITMAGKPCPFRATSGCGKFCKKHIIVG
jgi:hypothetical protein